MARQPETVEGYIRSIVDEITYWAEDVMKDISGKAFKDATDDVDNGVKRDIFDPQIMEDLRLEDTEFYDIFFHAYQDLYDHYYMDYSE